MDFNLYQEKASSFAILQEGQTAIVEAAFGLLEESGEVAGKLKRLFRDGKTLDVEEMKKEMGDVLWYLSQLSKRLGLSLEEVATYNLQKLEDRKTRNCIQGSGDNR